MKRDRNNRMPDWNAPEPLYCDLCGKKMSGEEVDNGFCEDCKEHVDGVEWNDAPTPESEQIKQPHESDL